MRKPNLYFFLCLCVLTVGFLSKKQTELNSPKVKWCCLWTAASCVRESDLEVFDVSFLQAPALERMGIRCRSTDSMAKGLYIIGIHRL